MLFNTNDSGTLLGAITAHRQYKSDKNDYANVLSYFNNGHQDEFLGYNIDDIANISDNVRESLKSIQAEAIKTGKTGGEALSEVEFAMEDVGSKGTKLGAVFKNIGKTLLNAFASAALSWGITKLGEGLKWVYDNWLTDNAKIEKELKKIEKANKNLEKSISDLTESESELSNVESEISRINDEISSIQSKGKLELTDEGDIDRLSRQNSLLQTQKRILENNIKLQKDSMAFSAKNVLDTGYTGRTYEVSDKSTVVSTGDENYSYKDWAKYYETAFITQSYNGYLKALSSGDNAKQKLYKEAVDKNSAEITQYISSLYEILQSFQDSEGNIINGYEDLYEEYTEIIANLQSLIDPNNFNQFVLDWSKDEKLNYDFEKGFNDVLEDMYSMEDFDFNELKSMNEEFFDKLSEQGISDDTITAILNYKKSLYDSVLQTISDTYNVENIPELKPSYLDNPNDTGVHLRTEDGVKIYDYVETRGRNDSEYDAIYDAEQKRLNEATDNAKSSYDSLTEYIKNHPMETGLENLPVQYKHLKDLMGDNWSDDLLNRFTPEERQLALKIEITDEGYDYDSLKKRLETKISPIEVEVKPKASDAVDSMADMKSAVASLSDLYNQTVLQAASENADSFATFAADPATLNSIESAFAKFIQENDGTEQLNAALQNFEKISVESFGSADYADQMRNAIDKLITAYVDQTDVIKNLTEENAEWSEAQLEAMGITNAHDVVQSRLSKQVKKTQQAIGKLAKQLIDYNEVMEDSASSDEAKADAISKLVPYVEDILTMYDGEGNAVEFSFGVTDEFVKKHQDDINAIAEGDIDALNRIRLAAAKEVVMRMEVDVPTEVFETQVNNIMDLVAQADAENIEIGAWLEDKPFLDALAEMGATSQATADAISRAFESMGYTATWVDNPYGQALATVQKSSSYIPASVVDEINRLASTQLNFPSLKIQRTGSSGGGTTAKYSAPSTSSSSGGSGGGGGGSEPTKPKEESEETFDWIEVAIQRIEEEISRLDKVVGNSYTLWGNRNKALRDEIEKTTEEIKAQQLAQSEYLRNANLVQVNNGKGLNDDDYEENDSLVKANDQKLLDEARAAWATGDYQRKVREGQMSGDDIEKIQNHFLTEAIQSYQDLYNKSVQAGDAVQDLQIKLGDLAQTKFDNVKDEYGELMQYITDAADVIDERINRTEEHGYFVSKSYYQDLKELEAQTGEYLKNEYEELIKKRDEAVADGSIAEGSSAWNKMNQEINAVNLEFEQHLTKMVEYNNAIRQLDWDFFDWVEERISRINDEASFLVDLMSNDQLYEKNGALTGLGHATNAMFAVQYETYMRQAQDYAEERKKLEAEIAKDPANKDLIARNEELIDQQQEMISNAEQMKDSVKSLVQEGINLYLESLQKLIDKYKESLSDARDLYSYQTSIADQTKNISNLRKQLEAYEGDDSEETRAVTQKLRTQLDDAEKKLQETEWDRYISETESFLDDMYNEMSETLNSRLENIDLLMHDMIDVANENRSLIQDTITSETEKVGYALTGYFDGIVNGDQSKLIVDLNNGFGNVTTAITNVQAVIEQIKNYASAMVDNGKSSVDKVDETPVNGTTPNAPTSKGGNNTGNNNGGNGSGNGSGGNNGGNGKRTEEDYYGVALAIANGGYGWGTGEERFKKLKEKGFDDDKVQSIVNQLFDEGYINSGAWVGRYAGITDISKYAYNKYAKGSKNISKDQLAWTQEKGQELIFRSSDGAMLTPLGTGDKVFTAQMTDNLWELAKGKYTTSLPKTGSGNTINNSNAISITLPNVKNYEEFKTALQNDPKMTSFIQQITLGEVSNGIKLNKRKY